MQVAELFQPLVDSPILLLLSINVFLFLAGMVMDLTPNVLIFAPVFYPLIQQAGIDPYFFGLLFILNLGIGVITPPVGKMCIRDSRTSRQREGQALTHSVQPTHSGPESRLRSSTGIRDGQAAAQLPQPEQEAGLRLTAIGESSDRRPSRAP